MTLSDGKGVLSECKAEEMMGKVLDLTKIKKTSVDPKSINQKHTKIT